MTVRDEDKRLEPVVVKRASEEIYAQIRLKVMSGELKPGDRLPSEKNIMEMMHRSRATVREALRMLEGDGHIRTIPGSAGAIIQKLDTRNMEQSYDALMRVERIGVRELGELRDIIQVQTAGWAAERRRNWMIFTNALSGKRSTFRIPAISQWQAGNVHITGFISLLQKLHITILR